MTYDRPTLYPILHFDIPSSYGQFSQTILNSLSTKRNTDQHGYL